MEEKAQIVPVTPGLLPALALLEQQTFRETFAGVYTAEDLEVFLQEKKSEAALATELSNPHSLYFMLYYEQRPTGFLKLNLNKQPDGGALLPEPAMEVEKIYVRQALQGKKLGKLLWEQALLVGRQHRMRTLWLGVWEHNLKAQQFYTRMGMQKFGEHQFYVGRQADNDWLLQMPL